MDRRALAIQPSFPDRELVDPALGRHDRRGRWRFEPAERLLDAQAAVLRRRLAGRGHADRGPERISEAVLDLRQLGAVDERRRPHGRRRVRSRRRRLRQSGLRRRLRMVREVPQRRDDRVATRPDRSLLRGRQHHRADARRNLHRGRKRVADVRARCSGRSLIPRPPSRFPARSTAAASHSARCSRLPTGVTSRPESPTRSSPPDTLTSS